MPDEPSNAPQNPTPTDDKGRIELYRQVVLEYEKLDAEIDALIMRNQGGTENMSETDYATYRRLAARRDELYNQIKGLESSLLGDDS